MLNRRAVLKSGLIMGCSAAAHPFMTTITLAGSDGGRPLGEKRLVVLLLRGAMDGLDLVQPVGDRDWGQLRPVLNRPDALGLTQGFALHPEAKVLADLWRAGEAAFVHATSTPYRDKRSHFQGQDLLEAGTGMAGAEEGFRDGWLNRLLQSVPGITAETAYAIGREDLRILHGAAATRSWAPELMLQGSPQMMRLLEMVWHDDDLFREAGAGAVGIDALMESDAGAMAEGPKKGRHSQTALARFAAERMREETRIAVFSLGGWDTHKGQKNGFGDALRALEETISTLKAELGPEIWKETAVLCLTEFGRTARENGAGGTDHGTGSVMVAVGGAVKGGQILGQWPGVAEGDLYQGRDLMSTSDVRDWTAHVIQSFYGLSDGVIENAVFPGLQRAGARGLIL